MSSSGTGLSVSITPSRSSTFAGEPFQAIISFTNTNLSDNVTPTATPASPESPTTPTTWTNPTFNTPRRHSAKPSLQGSLGPPPGSHVHTSSVSATNSPTRSISRQASHNRRQSAFVVAPPTASGSGLSHLLIGHKPANNDITILWSYTFVQGTLLPSPSHISPESLYPLRQSLLSSASSSFGSGSFQSPSPGFLNIPPPRTGRAPSLSGSLFGLAKGLIGGVVGSNGGSLEEERNKLWGSREVPVFESGKSVLGVDVALKGGEETSYSYSLPLPSSLPPSFKGKAMTISYSLVVGVQIMYGDSKKRENKEFKLPFRVWNNVTLEDPAPPYNLIHPIIQRKEEGYTQKIQIQPAVSNGTTNGSTHAPSPWFNKGGRHLQDKPKLTSRPSGNAESLVIPASTEPDTFSSLQSYAVHLLSTLEDPVTPPATPPPGLPELSETDDVPPLPAHNSPPHTPPPSAARMSQSIRHSHRHSRSQALSPSSHFASLPDIQIPKSLLPSSGLPAAPQPKNHLILDGMEGTCTEAVEILSRNSQKASYDIEKDGTVVAVVTVERGRWRVGEAVKGVVACNWILSKGGSARRVLKFTSFLESTECIPTSLTADYAPNSTSALRKTWADQHFSLTPDLSRLPFSLDLPSDATPSFEVHAGDEVVKRGAEGGVKWKIRLAFLVSVPPKNANPYLRPLQHQQQHQQHPDLQQPIIPIHLLPSPHQSHPDHLTARAGPSIAPFYLDYNNGSPQWREMKTEVIECEIPLVVLPGNTAFKTAVSVFEV